MEKNNKLFKYAAMFLFVLLACPQISWAGYQSADSNLPPLGGHYISPQEWHALYANGIIMKDPIHSLFTATFPPPAPDTNDTHNFSSRVEIMVSLDSGLTYQPFWADADVTVYIASGAEPNYYDTEMLQLNISGGSLPPGVMIRESPTQVSSGHTTIRSEGGGYQIDSFFDIFTEVSTDGGSSWYADTNAPARMTLAEGGMCRNPVGDLDADNVVDFNDLAIFAANWLGTPCDDSNQFCDGADIDDSNNVDFIDYAWLAQDWLTVGDYSPLVDAGLDQAITLPSDANLDGVATDEYGYLYGLPTPPGAITTLWIKQSGPNDVNFGDANAVVTTAGFVEAGVYVLRLTADDGELTTYDEVTITVNTGIVNQPPDVNAGNDQTITYHYGNPTSASLDGTVTDDGLPNPPGAVTTLWTKESGTGTVTFTDATAVDTTATFPDAGGVFVLRLTANDGDVNSYDEVQITVVGKPGWSDTADFYVDGYTGDNTHDGTINYPFKTIDFAADKLAGTAAKDKVLVWGGGGGGRPSTQTYLEQVSPGVNGTASYPNTIKRDPASGEAIIDSSGNTNGTVYYNSKSYAVIDGFTIIGAGDNGGVYIFQDVSDYITIKNCRIRSNFKHGIYIRDGDNAVINNCAIYSNNTGSGSIVYGVYVYNNVTATTITSSTIYSNNYGGIYAVTSAVIGTIQDCLVTSNGTYGIRAGTGGTITSPTYCDVWNQTTNYSNVTAGTGCKSGDPGYTDPPTNLTPTSTTYAKPASDGGWMGYRTSSQAL